MLKIYLILLFACTSWMISFSQSVSFNGLKVGDKAPLIETVDYNNDTVNISKLLEKSKIVLVFYRGAWCPYCNKHMSHLQDSLQFILGKGANVIAVTPEIESSIEKTIQKTKASFHILQDSNYNIMNQYGVAFKVDDKTVKKYRLFGIDLEESNGNSENILPVPATFIIGKDGIIEYLHFDENYKERMSVAEILQKL